jgi:hypothetical protein
MWVFTWPAYMNLEALSRERYKHGNGHIYLFYPCITPRTDPDRNICICNLIPGTAPQNSQGPGIFLIRKGTRTAET